VNEGVVKSRDDDDDDDVFASAEDSSVPTVAASIDLKRRSQSLSALGSDNSSLQTSDVTVSALAAVVCFTSLQKQQQQQPFNGLCSGTTRGRPVQEETLLGCAAFRLGSPPPVFWIFMEQGKIMEAEAPTVRVGATPPD